MRGVGFRNCKPNAAYSDPLFLYMLFLYMRASVGTDKSA